MWTTDTFLQNLARFSALSGQGPEPRPSGSIRLLKVCVSNCLAIAKLYLFKMATFSLFCIEHIIGRLVQNEPQNVYETIL